MWTPLSVMVPPDGRKIGRGARTLSVDRLKRTVRWPSKLPCTTNAPLEFVVVCAPLCCTTTERPSTELSGLDAVCTDATIPCRVEVIPLPREPPSMAPHE